jgi:hypothetical protein
VRLPFHRAENPPRAVRFCYRPCLSIALETTPSLAPVRNLCYRVVIIFHGPSRYIQTYINSFFSLPVKRQSGERLSHEEVVDQLDDQTVSYDVTLGVSGKFAETLRVSIRVEVAKYELAVAWLKDLLYGSEFTKERSVCPLVRAYPS